MPDRPEDQDNEPTRIVQRPGPKTVPLSVTPGPAPVHPSAAAPIAPTPVAPPPTPVAPRGGPVEPPRASEDPEATRVAARPRLTPPGQPVQRVGAPPPPPNVNAPTPVAPSPFAPQPVAPPVAAPTPVAPQAVAPQAVAPQAVAPQPIAPQPVAAPPAFPPMNEPPYAPPPAPPVYQPPVAPPPVAAPALAEPKPAQRAERPDPVRSLPPIEPVVGWIVIIKGPGRGASREIFAGRNAIGSDPDQLVPIDFGDPAIARRGHAFIVYDNEGREFFIEDGKQKELVRLNGQLLSETRQIHHHDEIRIGQTTMKLVCLCGPEFDWADKNAPKSDAVPTEPPAPAKPSAAAPVPEPAGSDAAGPEDAPMSPPDQPGDI